MRDNEQRRPQVQDAGALDGLTGLAAGVMSWTALLAMVVMPERSAAVVHTTLGASIICGLIAVGWWVVAGNRPGRAAVLRAGAALGGMSLLLVAFNVIIALKG